MIYKILVLIGKYFYDIFIIITFFTRYNQAVIFL